MVKTIAFLKRHPNMSPEEFRRYYEEVHVKIGEKYLGPYVSRYLRRYLQPLLPDPDAIASSADDYDVVTEMWYPDQASFQLAVESLSAPEAAAEILADEEKLFDRARTRFYVVDEQESTPS